MTELAHQEPLRPPDLRLARPAASCLHFSHLAAYVAWRKSFESQAVSSVHRADLLATWMAGGEL